MGFALGKSLFPQFTVGLNLLVKIADTQLADADVPLILTQHRLGMLQGLTQLSQFTLGLGHQQAGNGVTAHGAGVSLMHRLLSLDKQFVPTGLPLEVLLGLVAQGAIAAQGSLVTFQGGLFVVPIDIQLLDGLLNLGDARVLGLEGIQGLGHLAQGILLFADLGRIQGIQLVLKLLDVIFLFL